jgi:hypothetical protein
MSSKLLRNGRGTRRLYLRFVAEGRRESYRASQRCSQRQPVIVFEPGNSDGTRIVTIKILPENFMNAGNFPSGQTTGDNMLESRQIRADVQGQSVK